MKVNAWVEEKLEETDVEVEVKHERKYPKPQNTQTQVLYFILTWNEQEDAKKSYKVTKRRRRRCVWDLAL